MIIRIAAYRGMVQVPQTHLKQYTGAGVFLLDEPALWTQSVVLTGSTPNVSVVPPNESDQVRIIHVEVPDSQKVRYRIWTNDPLTQIAADGTCLSIAGQNNFSFAPGWRMSMVDAAGLP